MADEKIEGGCILIARNILNSEIWRKPPAYIKIFLYILLKVNHKNGLFPRGANFFNFSDEKPAGVTKNQIYEFLRWAKGKNAKILTTPKTTRGVIIKVNNYERFQSLENYYLQDKNQVIPNTTPTQPQDSYNTINNNVIMKECNKEINNIVKNKNFKIPSLEEITNYCLERGNNINPQQFLDYYTARGWMIGKNKMKDLKAAVRTWEQNEVKYNATNSIKKGDIDYASTPYRAF